MFFFFILDIFYPSLKYMVGCVWLFLQAQEGNIYFTELAERVEYFNYDIYIYIYLYISLSLSIYIYIYMCIYIYICIYLFIYLFI